MDGWIAGERGEQMRDRGAGAYDKYQKCGLHRELTDSSPPVGSVKQTREHPLHHFHASAPTRILLFSVLYVLGSQRACTLQFSRLLESREGFGAALNQRLGRRYHPVLRVS